LSGGQHGCNYKIGKTLKKMEKPRKTSKKQIFSSFSEKMVCDGVAL